MTKAVLEVFRMKKNGKKPNWIVISWLVVSFALMFASVDFGLLLLLIGGVAFLLIFALKKDRQIAERKRIAKQKEKDEIEKHDVKEKYVTSGGITIKYDENSPFDYIPVKVSGVTFNNGKRNRQTILYEILWKRNKYEGEVYVTLRRSMFEGKESIEVWANDEQIGFVPSSQTEYVLSNWNRIECCEKLRVRGGGETKGGERINFGATFILKLRKQ